MINGGPHWNRGVDLRRTRGWQLLAGAELPWASRRGGLMGWGPQRNHKPIRPHLSVMAKTSWHTCQDILLSGPVRSPCGGFSSGQESSRWRNLLSLITIRWVVFIFMLICINVLLNDLIIFLAI